MFHPTSYGRLRRDSPWRRFLLNCKCWLSRAKRMAIRGGPTLTTSACTSPWVLLNTRTDTDRCSLPWKIHPTLRRRCIKEGEKGGSPRFQLSKLYCLSHISTALSNGYETAATPQIHQTTQSEVSSLSSCSIFHLVHSWLIIGGPDRRVSRSIAFYRGICGPVLWVSHWEVNLIDLISWIT